MSDGTSSRIIIKDGWIRINPNRVPGIDEDNQYVFNQLQNYRVVWVIPATKVFR